MVAENGSEEAKKVVERIVLLETLGVGCSPTCTCRAALAVLLDDEQAKTVHTLAHGVTFDKKEPPEEAGVLAAFGLSTTTYELGFLKRMAKDKHLPENAETRGQKGGVAGAEKALRQAGAHILDGMLDVLIDSEFDFANMSDDDIRQAAYRR